MELDWKSIITSVIFIAVVGYVTKKANYGVAEGELKFGLFMKCFGFACLAFSATTMVVYLTGHYQVNKAAETTALIGLTLFFGLGAIYTLAEGFLVKGHFDECAITFTTPWNGTKQEVWEALESVEFNHWCSWYVLTFESKKVIRLSSMLSGHGYVLEFLQERGFDIC